MKYEHVQLAHGGGGKLTRQLIREVFLSALRNPVLDEMQDSAVIEFGGARMAFTTDSFVVKPLFFPGGDIGKLAVCGTVNDLAVVGASPLFLSLAVILEEGFPMERLEAIVDSAERAAREAGVEIVTGDTKVVERDSADELFITTSGLGVIKGKPLDGCVREGDKIVINGPVGDHGIAVISQREGLEFGTTLESDCAPLNHLVREMLEAGEGIRWMRDPTRGGLAASLNELAEEFQVEVEIHEALIPVRPEVRAACEMLGFDPLHVANEGKLVAVVDSVAAPRMLKAMWRNAYGRDATIIGEVVGTGTGKVALKTLIGGRRIVDMPVGDQLPRIC